MSEVETVMIASSLVVLSSSMDQSLACDIETVCFQAVFIAISYNRFTAYIGRR